MQNIGAVSSNKSVNSAGESVGKTAFSAGAQQADSALGAFEGIFEQLAALASGGQVGQSIFGAPSTALAQSEEDASLGQTSKNSKQGAGQFSQLPNGSFLMNAGDPTALLTAVTGDISKDASTKDVTTAGSSALKGLGKQQGGKDQQQGDPTNLMLDPAMIAAATAAALQGQNTQVDANKMVNATGGPVADALAQSGNPLASETKIPQVNFADLAESSGKNSGKLTAASSKVGLAGSQTTTGIVTSETGKAGALSTESAADSASAVHLSGKQSFSAQLQTQSNNLAAVSGEHAKKQDSQADVNASLAKDSKTDSSSVAANVQGAQQSSVPGAQVVPGVEGATAQAAVPRSSAETGSLTAEELAGIRAANAKKSGMQSKSASDSDVEGLASVTRAGSQTSQVGAGDKTVGQGVGAQSGTNPFSALDSAPTHNQQAQMLRATHREVEFGVQDSRYGWVEVKTQMNAGQVTASLSVSSAEAQHALQHELPAIQHFVASRDLNVSNISVSTETNGGAGSFSQQSGQGAGDQNQSFSQAPVGEVWRGQPSSPVSSTTTTENVWMPETASRISVMA